MDDQRTDRASGGMNDAPTKSRLRFSLKTLFTIMGIVAVLVGIYAWGYKNGTADTTAWVQKNILDIPAPEK